MNSKFDKLFNTIMEDVKSSKKHIIKEDTEKFIWNNYSEQYKQLIQAKAKQFGQDENQYNYPESLYYTFKHYDYKGFSLEEIKNMTKEEWNKILDTPLMILSEIYDDAIDSAYEDYDSDTEFYDIDWNDWINDYSYKEREYTYRDAADYIDQLYYDANNAVSRLIIQYEDEQEEDNN